MHMLVVEALLIDYLFYLGDEQILIDVRKSCRTSACLVRIAGPCPAEPVQLVHTSCGVRACESQPKRGLLATPSAKRAPCPTSLPERLVTKQCQGSLETHQYSPTRPDLYPRAWVVRPVKTTGLKTFQGYN